ncbi:MAG: ABC transporter ATP-binding protein [Coprococcus sp.]|nr:ABC transporter ATP-binding protein [Coprococcus sp.]
MDFLVEVKNVTKAYKNVSVLNDVNLKLSAGEVLGLVGGNGAGKTTLIRLITGMTKQDSGEIKLLGDSPANTAIHAGSLIEGPCVYGYMTAYDNLRYYGSLFGYCDKDRLKELLNIVGLWEERNKKVRHFSTGMKQRLGIAIALLGEIRVLLLDEPYNGLDADGVSELEGLIREIADKEKVGVIITSHIISELLKVCDRYMLMKAGTVVSEFTHEEVYEHAGDAAEAEAYIISRLGGAD